MALGKPDKGTLGKGPCLGLTPAPDLHKGSTRGSASPRIDLPPTTASGTGSKLMGRSTPAQFSVPAEPRELLLVLAPHSAMELAKARASPPVRPCTGWACATDLQSHGRALGRHALGLRAPGLRPIVTSHRYHTPGPCLCAKALPGVVDPFGTDPRHVVDTLTLRPLPNTMLLSLLLAPVRMLLVTGGDG